MAADRIWCRVTLVAPGGTVSATGRLSGPGAPDLATVELLARLRLAAQRSGRSLVVSETCGDLAGLLELAGLRQVLSDAPAGYVDPGSG